MVKPMDKKGGWKAGELNILTGGGIGFPIYPVDSYIKEYIAPLLDCRHVFSDGEEFELSKDIIDLLEDMKKLRIIGDYSIHEIDLYEGKLLFSISGIDPHKELFLSILNGKYEKFTAYQRYLNLGIVTTDFT